MPGQIGGLELWCQIGESHCVTLGDSLNLSFSCL